MRFVLMASAAALAAVAGCGGADSTTPPAPVVSRVTVTGTTTTLTVGQTTTVTAAAFNAAGTQVVTAGAAAWSSSAAAVATVDQAGKVTAVSAGSATITADVGGVKGTLIFTVASIAIASKDTIFTPGITFSPNQLTVARGANVIFALGFDGIGHDVRFTVKTGSPADIPVTTRQYIARNFAVAGSFPFFCPTHPEMTGVIAVQ